MGESQGLTGPSYTTQSAKKPSQPSSIPSKPANQVQPAFQVVFGNYPAKLATVILRFFAFLKEVWKRRGYLSSLLIYGILFGSLPLSVKSPYFGLA
jgi:hypothetical protein